jgi:hypothetical protein
LCGPVVDPEAAVLLAELASFSSFSDFLLITDDQGVSELLPQGLPGRVLGGVRHRRAAANSSVVSIGIGIGTS